MRAGKYVSNHLVIAIAVHSCVFNAVSCEVFGGRDKYGGKLTAASDRLPGRRPAALWQIRRASEVILAGAAEHKMSPLCVQWRRIYSARIGGWATIK